jgi:ABC-2 type transport system permease protein
MMVRAGVLIRKELLESWRTLRLPIICALFLFVGLSSPLLAKFLPEIVKAAGGDQLGAIDIPTPMIGDAVAQLWKNLAQFGGFAAIILAMGAVSGELDRGTAAFVLSKTATRGGFLAAKVVAIGAVLGLGTILAVLLGWIYTAILFGPPDPAGWLALAALAWLGLCAWAAITFLGSVVTGSTVAAAGIGFIGLLGLSIVSAVPNVSRLVPGGLAEPAMALANGVPVAAGDVLTPVIATVVLIVAVLAIAAWSFRRREL